MSWSFILVAAGSGSRIGGVPKQFRRLGSDPVWKWSAMTADRLFQRGIIDEMVVVFPRDYSFYEKDNTFKIPSRFVKGGAERTQSVLNALQAASGDFVLIHDAARPFLPAGICEDLISAVSGDETAGAVPLLESTDSLKLADAGISALPREKIFRTQTPQAFAREPLERILASSDPASDEAALWADAGLKLVSVRGSERNFKITTDFDWITAKALAEAGRICRVGMGYDVHELVPGRKLILGGVEVDSPLGLLGHSDADIICHAVMDALLGAAGEGDIGTMFPASSELYKDADSAELLGRVIGLVTGGGWRIANIDITLKAQVPRLGGIINAIRGNLERLITPNCIYAGINIKVKSGEMVGSTGRAECMECYAVAGIEKYEI